MIENDKDIELDLENNVVSILHDLKNRIINDLYKEINEAELIFSVGINEKNPFKLEAHASIISDNPYRHKIFISRALISNLYDEIHNLFQFILEDRDDPYFNNANEEKIKINLEMSLFFIYHFIFLHELNHLIQNHIKVRGENKINEINAHVNLEEKQKNIYHVTELSADAGAIAFYFYHRFKDFNTNKEQGKINEEDEASIYLSALTGITRCVMWGGAIIMYLFYEDKDFTRDLSESTTHPHPFIRLMCICNRVKSIIIPLFSYFKIENKEKEKELLDKFFHENIYVPIGEVVEFFKNKSIINNNTAFPFKFNGVDELDYFDKLRKIWIDIKPILLEDNLFMHSEYIRKTNLNTIDSFDFALDFGQQA